MKSIAIIVVTYNRLDLLKEVIASIKNQTVQDCDIIVINNGSTDGTEQWLAGQDYLQFITQSNVGGAGGFFTGIKYAAENGYEFCWMMDDDVICNCDALEKLLLAYNKKSNIGFVCSKVIGVDGCPMNTPLVDTRPTENGYSDFADLLEYKMLKIRTGTFVSVLISTAVVYEIGLPYKEYFIWGDDTEYTTRISNKFSAYMVGDSIVVHKRSLQKSLSFENEPNDARIDSYFYYYRNNWNNEYIGRPWKDKVKYACSKIKEGLNMIKDGNVRKGEIYIKAASSLILFNPSISFPQKRVVSTLR